MQLLCFVTVFKQLLFVRVNINTIANKNGKPYHFKKTNKLFNKNEMKLARHIAWVFACILNMRLVSIVTEMLKMNLSGHCVIYKSCNFVILYTHVLAIVWMEGEGS